MKFLSRPEEFILFAIWRLGELAYCVEIRRELRAVTRKNWSFGAIYVPLGRLEKRGLIKSRLASPTPMRGGRSKRYYALTKYGLKALAEARLVHESMWSGQPRIVPDESVS
jgi:PadR family transcriptional regulator, regulatory protein PadR